MSKVVEIIRFGGNFDPPTYEVLHEGLKPEDARELCNTYASRVPPLGKGRVIYLAVKDTWKNDFPC